MFNPILTARRRSAPVLTALVSGLVLLACGGDGDTETRFEVETVSLPGGAGERFDRARELAPAPGMHESAPVRSRRVAIEADTALGAAVDASTTSLSVSCATAPTPLERAVHELVATLGARGPLEHPQADGGTVSSSGVPGFEGTGGPGGTFDVHIPPGTTMVFDTVSTVFVGGPGGQPTTTQVAVNGRLDVRDLYIPESSTLRVQGPNPVRILATGNVVVEGQLVAAGISNRGVVTLHTANIPEPGAPGVAGGGRGGTASFLTTMHTPRGGAGAGAFDRSGTSSHLGSFGRGGQGGESATSSTGSNDIARRPGGGGGGRFGGDVRVPASPAMCSDQDIVGLDVEPGFAGFSQAVGAVSGGSPPQGGLPGLTPFVDGTPKNDFWGKLVTANGSLVQGELPRPWAGSGGGAGGDAIRNPNFLPSSAEKGAGGGGGGGQVRIQALGDVVLGPRGAIDVRGGNGGGGESTGGVNRIGGGSGGGSGGHLIIETASRIDLSQLDGTFPGSASSGVRDVGLLAPGGQGGAGADNNGGAITNGIALPPCRDALPTTAQSCVPQGCMSCWPVVCAGGDGGPGIIQLHVQALDGRVPGSGAIVPPLQASSTLFRRGVAGACSIANLNGIKNAGVIKPPPVGAPSGEVFGNDTVGWDRLVPTFGAVSSAPSSWIPLDGTGLPRALPRPAGFAVELQATSATLSGRPDEAPGVPSAWVDGPDRLGDGTGWAFVRVRVRLDGEVRPAGAPGIAAPLDVLRVPLY